MSNYWLLNKRQRGNFWNVQNDMTLPQFFLQPSPIIYHFNAILLFIILSYQYSHCHIFQLPAHAPVHAHVLLNLSAAAAIVTAWMNFKRFGWILKRGGMHLDGLETGRKWKRKRSDLRLPVSLSRVRPNCGASILPDDTSEKKLSRYQHGQRF